MSQVGDSHHLPNAVHGQLRHPQIDSTNTSIGTEYRTDGGTTWTIGSDTKFLNRNCNFCLPRQFTGNEARDAVCRIALILVRFDYNTLQ